MNLSDLFVREVYLLQEFLGFLRLPGKPPIGPLDLKRDQPDVGRAMLH